MNKNWVAGLSAVALALGSIAPAAFADDDHGRWDRGGYDHGWDRGGYDHGWDRDRDWRRDNWNNRGWNYGGYGNGYYRNGWYGDGYRYRRHGDDNGTALGIGLGVVGLALVLAAANSGKSRDRTVYRDRDRERNWDRDDDRRRDDDRNWRDPDQDYDGTYRGAQTAYSTSPDWGRCVQTREYQTRITVGGETRPAYGTACLMPDGQWLKGEPILEPR